MKFIKPLLDFWKKDIINKLIVLVLLVLVSGVFGVGILILSTSQGSSLIESVSQMLPSMPTPTFDVNTYLTPRVPVVRVPTQTAENFVNVPTFTPFIFPTERPLELPTSAVDLFTPTAETLPTPVSQPTAAQSVLSSEAACVPNNPRQTGRVVEVLDGNTVRALLKDTGLIYTVRYIGIIAPKNSPFAETAKFKNSQLVYGQSKEITLIMDKADKDDRGRLLRYVLVDNSFINLELLKLGFGSADTTDFSCIQLFKQAEQSAKTTGTGVWAPTSTPIP